uniref:Ala1 protein n=1 Tax=Fopius arisanus TaxID=64838 RepID=A0A0C9RK18_9HYME
MHVSLIIRCCLAFPKVERKFSLKEIIKVEMFSWSPRSSLVIVFIPVVIGFFVDFSGANDQCKNKMMNIVMKVCSGAGVKSRRDIEDHWTVPHSTIRGKFVHRLQKRQQPREFDPFVGSPGDLPGGAVPPVPVVPPESHFGNPPRDQRFIGLLQQEANIGPELKPNIDELDDLYDELSERFPRQLKDNEKMRKMFFDLADECCRHDVDLCFESSKLLKCV